MNDRERISVLLDVLGHVGAEVEIVRTAGGVYEARAVKRMNVCSGNYGRTEAAALAALTQSLRFLAQHVERNARVDTAAAQRDADAKARWSEEIAGVLAEVDADTSREGA